MRLPLTAPLNEAMKELPMKVKDHSRPMSLSNKLLVIVLFSAILGLAGCQQEGPAEKTGQKIRDVPAVRELKKELLSRVY